MAVIDNKKPRINKPLGATLKKRVPKSNLEKYAIEVLNTLHKKGIKPTPHNFYIYFEKLLDDKPKNFEREVRTLMDNSDVNLDSHIISLENNMNNTFSDVKKILKYVNELYKNTTLVKKLVSESKTEISKVHDLLSAQNILNDLDSNLSRVSRVFTKYFAHIKETYSNLNTKVKELGNKSIFDNRFGIYNKKYILSYMNKMLENISQADGDISILMINVKDSTFKGITDISDETVIVKTIAKLLLKTSRRSDSIGYYKDNVFLMVLTHTDIQNAKRAAGRIEDLMENSNLFLNGVDINIELDISIGLAKKGVMLNLDKLLAHLESGLFGVKNDNGYFVIDNEEKDD